MMNKTALAQQLYSGELTLPEYLQFRTAAQKDWVRQVPAWQDYISHSSIDWQELETPDDVAVSAWSTTTGAYPTLVVFTPRTKKAKPEYFRTEDHMLRTLEAYVNAYRQREAYVRSKNEQRKLQVKNLNPKVGDILYSSWGYDQTNVDFYEVTAVANSMVEIREVASKIVSEKQGTAYVTALPGRFVGPPMKKRVAPSVSETNSYHVKITSFSSASLWDGRPKYQTASGWGH